MTRDREECIHELPWGQCSLCKPRPVYSGAYWDAMYSSKCATCPVRIEAGDRVRWSDDGTEVQHAKHR